MAVTAVTGLAACTLDGEPAHMCGSLDLGPLQTRSLTAQTPTVVALSDGAGQVTVVRACEEPGCAAELVSQTLTLGINPDQLLLTASGRWLAYRVGANLFRLDLELDAPTPVGGPGDVDEIVGSLRGGDWLLYRSWGAGSGPSAQDGINDSELWAYYVGELDALATDADGQPVARPHFHIGEGLGLDLRVAAMGHRHVVARRLLGNGEEELYLIRIAPARRHDQFASTDRGKPLLLARGRQFTRVLITEGPSPAERGDPWEFQHEVPTDVQVIATSGAGADARTLVYGVADAAQIANFDGAVVSSPIPLEDVAGLSAIAPSGTHLAYITPRGSLALRDLDSHESCMIRPATGARHLLAGFAADGTMYFESRERGPTEVGGAAGAAANLVYAYDAAAEQLTALTDDRHSWRLYAAPPQRYQTEDGRTLPWAVVALDGFYAAGPALAGAPRPEPLGYDEVSFLPRGDDSLWLLEGEQGERFADPNWLSLRRVRPGTAASEAGAAIAFDSEHADPSVLEDGSLRERFTRAYPDKATVCVSTSQSASRTTPWATSCSTPDEPTGYLDSGLPHAEAD